MPSHERSPLGVDTAKLLSTGTVEIEGRMPWSSNGTFLVTVADSTNSAVAIYKPARFERPLWDFPGGLYRREVAAFELAGVLGWDIVPLTVEVGDSAPLGAGSMQLFVDAVFEEHYLTLIADGAHRRSLRRIAAFDVIANNTDRKSGHCLLDRSGHIWGIDHGLCFHPEPKLRTVIWDFAGEPLDEQDLEDLRAVDTGEVDRRMRNLLDAEEREAVCDRLGVLVAEGQYPYPQTNHPYPWPLV